MGTERSFTYLSTFKKLNELGVFLWIGTKAFWGKNLYEFSSDIECLFFLLDKADCYRRKEGTVEGVRGKEIEIQEFYLVGLVKAVIFLTVLLTVHWERKKSSFKDPYNNFPLARFFDRRWQICSLQSFLNHNSENKKKFSSFKRFCLPYKWGNIFSYICPET